MLKVVNDEIGNFQKKFRNFAQRENNRLLLYATIKTQSNLET